MADWAAIAGGFETRLATISGLHAYSEWPDQLNVPAAIVLPAEPFAEDATFDGEYDAQYDVLVLTSRASSDARSQVALLAYFATSGASSIRDAILGDKTLGGTCDDLIPAQIFGYGVYEHAGISYTGMKHRWKVLA